MRCALCLVIGLVSPLLAVAADYVAIVSNELSGDLTVIDGKAHGVIATIAVGKRPRGLFASADGKTLYVALSGSPLAGPDVDESKLPPPDKGADGIGVVDLVQHRLRTIVRGVSDPEQVVEHKGRLFVASEDTGQLLVLDAATGAKLAQLDVGGEPEGLGLSPSGEVLYVTSEADHQVSAVDTANLRLLGRVDVGARPRSIVFDRKGLHAYVTGESDGTLTVIDAQKLQALRTVHLEGENVRPMGVQISPSGDVAYVSTGRGGTVLAVDTKTDRVRGTVAVGPRPWGIALSPDGSTLYSASGPSNDVSIVSTATMQVQSRVAVGTRPWGVVIAKR